ncbi:hypothetical protein IJX73_02320 [bacterium]|nr:hypothetical protein [bacterium]
MQISSINSQISSKGRYENNPAKIYELEQRNQANRWASEGCNGCLSEKDAHELDLRREYQALQNKHIALQWGNEGCNGGLSLRDMDRLQQIEEELREIAPEETAPIETLEESSACEIDAIDKAITHISNPYGVPDSTFFGDWAR